MKKKEFIGFVFVLVLALNSSNAQSMKDYPVVGEAVPDFTITNIKHYERKTFNPRDIKNKWIILDFWNRLCVPCVKSFPKLNELQQKFKNDIQFVLVGMNDTHNNGIEKAFERHRTALNLKLVSAYDSALYTRFKVNGAPHVVVIDPDYNVYAVTYGTELTEQNLTLLIAGKRPVLKRKYYDFEAEETKPGWKYQLFKRDTAEDFLFRTVLSPYCGESIGGGWIDLSVKTGSFYVTGATLRQLYTIAYLGEASWGRQGHYFTHWKYPILEIEDSIEFHPKRLYNYSLVVPANKSTRDLLMKTMQRDLQSYFGYVIAMETRPMPYWRLTATDVARKNLLSKSKVQSYDFTMFSIRAKGIVIRNVLENIEQYNGNEDLPLIDETGITGLIDISLDANMGEITAVQKALRKQGLVLEKATKPTQVLVIRDPSN